MTTVVPVVANVLAATGAALGTGTAGATIAQGDVLYADGTDGGDLKLGDSSGVLTAAVVGIALNAALDKQPVDFIKSGTLTIGTDGGAPPAAGEPYFLSTTAGKIDDALPASGQFATVLGIGLTSSTMKVGIVVSGVALA